MHKLYEKQTVILGSNSGRVVLSLLWLAVLTGWIVSIFSVIQEMCMVSACRDTASFTIFGFNMGWFGIAYFSLVLIMLWLRKNDVRADLVFSVFVFSGIGAELRLLWIQKYVIGGWCPLCVTICCALFLAAALQVIEKVWMVKSGQVGVKSLLGWLTIMLAMSALGLIIAVEGVKALI